MIKKKEHVFIEERGIRGKSIRVESEQGLLRISYMLINRTVYRLLKK